MKSVKKKYITETYLRDVEEYEYNLIEDKENDCYISIKKILSIKSPFCTKNSGCLIDNMYSIIEVVPLDENYCIRLFIDDNNKIILYYFDITLKNGFDNDFNSPYYKDLFLDVILKDDQISILDEEELNEALENKNITIYEYNLAQNVKSELISSLRSKTNKYMNIKFTEYLW